MLMAKVPKQSKDKSDKSGNPESNKSGNSKSHKSGKSKVPGSDGSSPKCDRYAYSRLADLYVDEPPPRNNHDLIYGHIFASSQLFRSMRQDNTISEDVFNKISEASANSLTVALENWGDTSDKNTYMAAEALDSIHPGRNVKANIGK